eukprot:scaffold29023_cov24-Tisochrysis_lutea.AAC.1
MQEEEESRAQSLSSSMTPPKRPKECRWDNFLVRPVQGEQNELTHHYSSFEAQLVGVGTHLQLTAQSAEQRNSREAGVHQGQHACQLGNTPTMKYWGQGCASTAYLRIWTVYTVRYTVWLGKIVQPQFQGGT